MKLAALVFLFATEMVRVLEVPDGRTLVVERNGQRAVIQLAGVELTDPRAARELLAWNAARGSWVMLEPQGEAFRVYRSPDALFLNRELVLRGTARASEDGIEPAPLVPMKYLGVVNPGMPSRAPSRAGALQKPKKERSKAPSRPLAPRARQAPRPRLSRTSPATAESSRKPPAAPAGRTARSAGPR